MTLLIELNFYLDDNPIFPYEFVRRSIKPDTNLSDDFLKLYEFEKKGHVIINVQGVEFPVHKTVLETRCPELHDMVADNSQLALTDVNPDIFKRVLDFIYTGKVKDLDDHAEDLLKAATRFKLERLKNLCEFSLIENYVTFENCDEVKKLAVSCDASQLLINVIMVEGARDEGKVFSSTIMGTLIMNSDRTGEKEVYENRFTDGIPKGIEIVPE